MDVNKQLINDLPDETIATFKSDASQAITYCPDDTVNTMGETHKAMVKALESFKNIIVQCC